MATFQSLGSYYDYAKDAYITQYKQQMLAKLQQRQLDALMLSGQGTSGLHGRDEIFNTFQKLPTPEKQKAVTKSYREELQAEIDEWLK